MTFSGNTTSLGLFHIRGSKMECHHPHPGRRVAPFLEPRFFRQMRGQQPAAHADHWCRAILLPVSFAMSGPWRLRKSARPILMG